MLIFSVVYFTGCEFKPTAAPISDTEDIIMTVCGPIKASEFGKALVHEHVMCDFIGASKTGPDRYDTDHVVETMLPYLRDVKKRGITSFVDCSPAYIGQDAEVLSRLSEAADLHIVTNTGYYGAAGDKYLPDHAYEETAEELAERWAEKWEKGIGETGIRPGFIKTGVDAGKLSEIDKKLVVAAAKTHLKTGLTIACHTGEAQAALEVLQTVRENKVDPSALIIVHADSIKDFGVHQQLAQAGAWVEYDSIGARPIPEHVELIKKAVEAGFADRLLISHDAGWYQVGEKGGGNIRGYTAISDKLIGALKDAGISGAVIDKLLVDNPAEALTIRKRKL